MPLREQQLYLDLTKKVLTNVIYEDPGDDPRLTLHRFDANLRINGLDWPQLAHTMVGLKRLDNVQYCLEQVLSNGVLGDFIETGVWRGGTCIFARAVFKAHGITSRTIWVADSFQGIPEPSDEDPDDMMMLLHNFNKWLSISEETVRQNFERYDLLDDHVRSLPGWFKDTLPTAPIEQLAVLRSRNELTYSSRGSMA